MDPDQVASFEHQKLIDKKILTFFTLKIYLSNAYMVQRSVYENIVSH